MTQFHTIHIVIPLTCIGVFSLRILKFVTKYCYGTVKIFLKGIEIWAKYGALLNFVRPIVNNRLMNTSGVTRPSEDTDLHMRRLFIFR